MWRAVSSPNASRRALCQCGNSYISARKSADVTLFRGSGITVHVRFNGGATKTLELPKPLTAWELRTTPAEVVAEIDRLTDQYTDKQIVEILNQRGALSGCGQHFNSRIVARLRHEYQLKPRYDRLREKGLLTLEEMSALLDIGPKCVITWRNHGLLHGHPVNDRDD